MKYDSSYIETAVESFAEQFNKDYEQAEYTIEIDQTFKDPPIVQLCKFMQDTADLEMQDKMIRYCVLDRQVTVYLDGVNVGGFRMNGLADAWEVIPVINEHPKAYKMLADIVTGYLAKKFTLPRKKIPVAPGAPVK